MEYLNNYYPIAWDIDQPKSLKDFIEDVEFTGNSSKNTFNPDKIILDCSKVIIEFMDGEGEPVFKIFESDTIPGLTEPGFTAGEMFYNILSYQNKLDSWYTFFEGVEPIEETVEEVFTAEFIKKNGIENAPIYRANFGS